MNVNISFSGIFLSLLTLMLIYLKLIHKISISWWWVWSPMWVPGLIFIIVVIIVVLIAGISALIENYF